MLTKRVSRLFISFTSRTEALRVLIAVSVFAALMVLWCAPARAQDALPLKRLAPLRSVDVAAGSRVTITSDAAINDYSTYCDAGRFFVVIPQADAGRVQSSLSGRAFADTLVERRGNDVVLSFGLRAGVTARVHQKFNRLEIIFSAPGKSSAGDAASNSAVVTLTENFSARSETNTVKPSTTKSRIALPPETAQPVKVPRYDKPPAIDGRLDDTATTRFLKILSRAFAATVERFLSKLLTSSDVVSNEEEFQAVAVAPAILATLEGVILQPENLLDDGEVHTVSTQESLGEYVRRILKEKNLSLSDVEQRANGRISDSYICNISSGNIGSLTVTKLKALARGLGVPEDELFAVARGVSPEQDAMQGSAFAMLFDKYKGLSSEDKREVEPLLKVLDNELERRQRQQAQSAKGGVRRMKIA